MSLNASSRRGMLPARVVLLSLSPGGEGEENVNVAQIAFLFGVVNVLLEPVSSNGDL
jgi:hypothetical protein